ncbi:glycogen synthase [Aquimarina sp. D1M17]|uniref:glycogen synthase n=1 Tax=Aquimarina acroporae TaxID=2937283 RepID=UPI0020C11D2F|nr:glycogen/starch synthase [Aquimarina acroporae]MCK8520039.1 glycogen synthase [Aquimarina acroporae]
MHILHISFECYPIAKVGGLADVVGALPKYQQKLDHKSSVILPYYENKFRQSAEFKEIGNGNVQIGDTTYQFSILQLDKPDVGFDIYTVYIEGLLDREEVYNHFDDTERFLAFQLSVLNWLNVQEEVPDIIHCHDHHTGLIPFLISHASPYTRLKDIVTIFTIHNAQYQGHISYDKLHYLPDFDKSKIGLIDWDNQINPLATGIKCAWQVTTVSPNYMQELQKNANGLESLLSHEQKKCIGVLNGIDVETWDPDSDSMLIKNYTETSYISGKKENKKWLCEEFDLNPDLPLFSFIGRLVGEKGADLLPEIIGETLDRYEVNILILGSGDPRVEHELEILKEKYKGKYNTYIGYNEELSHKIYAGSDFLLMPSRVEPCGLNQMYALRYGTIPIVRRTGGLKDTVIDIGDNGFGFCHDNAMVWDVCYSIKRATDLYDDQKRFKGIQKQIMKIDHSWASSAKQYINIYSTLITQK